MTTAIIVIVSFFMILGVMGMAHTPEPVITFNAAAAIRG